MNIIYMGEGCYGVKSAAATYFGKELQELTLAECASLIGITNNPSLYDPYISDKTLANNRERQLTILDQMLDQGWIDQDRYDEAVAQEMVFKSGIADADRWVKCETEGCGYQGPVRDLVHEEGLTTIIAPTAAMRSRSSPAAHRVCTPTLRRRSFRMWPRPWPSRTASRM